MAGINVEEIKEAIKRSEALWQAEETPFVKMSPDEQARHLGYTPGPDDLSLEEEERAAKANLRVLVAMRTADATAPPPSFDLRNVGGSSFITDVQDQDNCGSCVAFGTIAAMEGTMRKQRNDPNLDVNYSEAHLFYCHARSQGRRCSGAQGGWSTRAALKKLRDIGVADDTCYPYTDVDQNCSNLCPDWQNRTRIITGWKRLRSPTKMKEWISSRGPLVACYTIFEDFYAYASGIYSHVTGKRIGGHCVCIVGYNDTEQYWICKNSWGKDFGESGYFRIAYGECGIDSSMDAIEGIVETGGSLEEIFRAKGISFPVSIRTVAQKFGLRLPISVRALTQRLLQ